MKTKFENRKVQAMGGNTFMGITLGSTFLATSTDFIVAALIVIFGLVMVIYTMSTRNKAH